MQKPLAAHRAGRKRRLRSALQIVGLILLALALASPAASLIFASPETEPPDGPPPDFPYWNSVTQRRYEGPTVLYLGGGYGLTARHVGMGEILLDGQIVEPVPGSKRTLLNENGSAADAMIFRLESDFESEHDAVAMLPIATEPLRSGEEILMIGFGKTRERVIEYQSDGRDQFGFSWTDKGAKRWGTNRVEMASEILTQNNFHSRAISLYFDEPNSSNTTAFEAQAAVGDSGGAVFVKRDGEWQLAAMMVSVSGPARGPEINALYGDRTFAVDLTYYRDQVLRWTRPDCSNELDDDGDGLFDYPNDPGCESAGDSSERDRGLASNVNLWISIAAATGIAVAIAIAIGLRFSRQRGTSTPISTRPSSAA